MQEHPKVFISYSHQDETYENKVLEFSNRLRSDGIDATIDLYEEAPAEGWPRWMENQINNSDFVLILNSESYYNKCYDETMKAKGISWEVNIVYQHIYDAAALNTKYIPIFFDASDEQYILTPIKPFTYYNVGTQSGYERLYNRLLGIPKTEKPPLGKIQSLPAKEKRTMFFSTPIDLKKWDAAKWTGMVYFFPQVQDQPPCLGFVYKNYQAGVTIFESWKKLFNDGYADNHIKIDYIIPPFPKDAWIYKDKDHNYGKGYFVHIGPNLEESVNEAVSLGLDKEDLFITAISRYQWMSEENGSINRDSFQQLTASGSEFQIIPVGIKDSQKAVQINNMIFDFQHAIKMKRIYFRAGDSIDKDDHCSVVFNKPDVNE